MRNLLQYIGSQAWAMPPEYVGVLLSMIKNGGHGEEAALSRKDENKTAKSPGNIAVVPVSGFINARMSMLERIMPGIMTSAEGLEAMIRAAYDDDDNKAIVLDINSPGGMAAGVPELATAIRSMRGGDKPIIAQVQGMAASAAYWIASATDEIVATPSSVVGSIGVIAIHEDISRMEEDMGITNTVISAGKYKSEGNPFEPLTEEGRAAIQARVDDYYKMFVAAVAEGRDTDKATVRSGYGEGRTVIAEKAKSEGMIDRIGSMRDTLQRLGASYDSEGDRSRASARRSVRLEAMKLQLERNKQ